MKEALEAFENASRLTKSPCEDNPLEDKKETKREPRCKKYSPTFVK